MTISLKDYQEHPIFLHAVNKELHNAVGKPVDTNDLLHAIRLFSIVSCQKMFCNVSQIHEVFFDKPEALIELAELSKIGRFVAHSDYGSFDEFRESRMEKFAHSRTEHPAFFDTPSEQLLMLPHDSMGKSVSTTGHIEQNLTGWLESQPESSLFRTLSQNDAKSLRTSDRWIAKTLQNRDQKALTFDVFHQMAEGVVSKKSEGAVRRSLTEVYIDSYLVSFDPRCIWGFRGINHFEKMSLMTGMHYRFAQAILVGTGIDSFLNENCPENYGQLERLLSEHTQQLAVFRESYAKLAVAIDADIESESAWHMRDGKILAHIQKLNQSSILRPKHDINSYGDVLLNAAEALRRAKTQFYNSYPALAAEPRIFSFSSAKPSQTVSGTDLTNKIIDTASVGSVDAPRVWESYIALVLAGGVAMTLATFFLIPELLAITFGIRLFASLITGVISALIINWFHPDNFLRRMALGGLALFGWGSLSYKFKVLGIEALGDSVLEIENTPSNLMIGGGIIIFIVCICLDAYVRLNKRS